jgi:hypothetical protein
MIVIYDKANLLTLTYVDGPEGKKSVKKFTFVPGRNEIPAEAWGKAKDAVLKRPNGEEQWAHYSRYLKPVVDNDEPLDVVKLDAKDLEELIENTMQLEELAEIEAEEKKRERPRKAVMKAIEAQAKKIRNFREAVDNG